VPQLLADYLNIQRYENNDIEFESGNFMCDGHGTAFSTDGYDNTHELFNGITSSRWLDVIRFLFLILITILTISIYS
jgi:hypothetical protein